MYVVCNITSYYDPLSGWTIGDRRELERDCRIAQLIEKPLTTKCDWGIIFESARSKAIWVGKRKMERQKRAVIRARKLYPSRKKRKATMRLGRGNER